MSIINNLLCAQDCTNFTQPTGALDEENGNMIMDILEKFHQKGVTIVMVTHDADLANKASRIVQIREGIIH